MAHPQRGGAVSRAKPVGRRESERRWDGPLGLGIGLVFFCLSKFLSRSQHAADRLSALAGTAIAP